MSREGRDTFILGVEGANLRCQYLDTEKAECRLVEEEKKTPKMTRGCNCAKCLIALHNERIRRARKR